MTIEQILAQFITSMPVAGVFLVMLKIVYDDNKAEREQARSERMMQLVLLTDIKNELRQLNLYHEAMSKDESDNHNTARNPIS